MENPTRVCEVLVGLGDVEVLGVDDEPAAPLGVRIRTRRRPPCGGCGGAVWSKGTSPVRLVDLPAFGRPVRLIWHKWRWRCPAARGATRRSGPAGRPRQGHGTARRQPELPLAATRNRGPTPRSFPTSCQLGLRR